MLCDGIGLDEMGWDWTASTVPWYWMVLDGIGDDAMLCDASCCDAMVLLGFIWMGWVRMAMAM